MGLFSRSAGVLCGAALVTYSFTGHAQNCGRVTVNVPDVNLHPLQHQVSGNSQLGDKGVRTRVEVRAHLNVNPGSVRLMTHATMKGQGRTRFEGVREQAVYTLPRNSACEIDRVTPSASRRLRGDPVHGELSGSKKKNKYQWSTFPGRSTGIVRSAECKLNERGPDDRGRVGCRRVRFRSFEVHLRPKRVSCGTMTVKPTPQLVFPVQHRTGPRDLGNGRHWVFLGDRNSGVRTYTRGNAFMADLLVQIGRDVGSSNFQRTFTHIVAHANDAPPGCRITSGRLSRGNSFEERSPVASYDWVPIPITKPGGGTEFEHVFCRTAAQGTDVGKLGCWVHYRPATIQLGPAGVSVGRRGVPRAVPRRR